MSDELPDDDDDEVAEPAPLPPDVKNYMTPRGHQLLKDELHQLMRVERPRVVEIVSWAAGNGDRSENGDYIYNKKRLREIDRRARYLTKRLDRVEVIDPRRQQGLERVFFGATVTYAHDDGRAQTVKLVAVDEADVEGGRINWISPMGRALFKKQVGDMVEVQLATGRVTVEVIEITYIVDET